MEIDKTFLEALSYGNSSSSISTQQYIDILKIAFASILEKLPPAQQHKSLEKIEIDQIIAKQFYSSITTLIVEIARYDISTNQIKTLLDVYLDKDRITLFIQAYTQYKDLIRTYLCRHTIKFPHIIDLNWRIDYSVQSNTIEDIYEYNYFIEMIIDHGNGIQRPIAFTTDTAGLQDLLGKVKDALNAAKQTQ